MYFDIKSCGARIRKLREKKNMSQSELAEKLNITNIHLSRIETGSRGASLDLLMEISEVFQVSLDYLVTGRMAQLDHLMVKEKLRQIVDELSELEREMKG